MMMSAWSSFCLFSWELTPFPTFHPAGSLGLPGPRPQERRWSQPGDQLTSMCWPLWPFQGQGGSPVDGRNVPNPVTAGKKKAQLKPCFLVSPSPFCSFKSLVTIPSLASGVFYGLPGLATAPYTRDNSARCRPKLTPAPSGSATYWFVTLGKLLDLSGPHFLIHKQRWQ